VYFYKIHSHI